MDGIATTTPAKKAPQKLPGLTNAQKREHRELLKDLASKHVPKVVARLAAIVDDKRAPHSAQIAAGNSLLDRYGGKPKLEDPSKQGNEVDRMSNAEVLAVICESIVGLSTQAEVAKRYYRALAGLAVNGDGARPEIVAAESYLSQN
jgi:hypothetical protein